MAVEIIGVGGNKAVVSPTGELSVNQTSTIGLTDTQMRATPVPVSGPVTDTELRASKVPVQIGSIVDDYGFEVENTPMGEMRTVTPVRLVGANFDGSTLDANFWGSATANAGAVTPAGSEVTLTNGTNPAGSAQLYSVRRARYVSGSTQAYRSVHTLDAGTANNTRRFGVGWGASFPVVTDGAWFQYSGTTFQVVVMKGTTPTTISTGSFNGGLGVSYTPPTTATTFEIYWTNSKVYFVIGSTILHTFSANTTSWANTVHHYVFMDSVNAGAANSVNMTCRVVSIRRLGPLATQLTSKYFAVGLTAGITYKTAPGNLYRVILSNQVSGAIITLYDNTAASGTVIWSATLNFGNQGAAPYVIDFAGLPFFNGLTLVVATANCSVVTVYE